VLVNESENDSVKYWIDCDFGVWVLAMFHYTSAFDKNYCETCVRVFVDAL